jgi:hypothetical protein
MRKTQLFNFGLMFDMEELPFYMSFPYLFAKSKNPLTVTMTQVWNSGDIAGRKNSGDIYFA